MIVSTMRHFWGDAVASKKAASFPADQTTAPWSPESKWAMTSVGVPPVNGMICRLMFAPVPT